VKEKQLSMLRLLYINHYLEINFAQAISSNQGLIELTLKEQDGFGIVLLK